MLSNPSSGTYLGTQWLVGLNIIDNDRLLADFNADSIVNGLDFLVWQSNFGTLRLANHADGDADRDGDVDGSDFLHWQRLFDAQDPSEPPGHGGAAVVDRPLLRRVDTSFVVSRQTDETRGRRERLIDLALTPRQESLSLTRT